MTRARRLWLTLHRWLGLGLGAWFVLLGLTGSLLVFYPAMEPWFDARITPRAAPGPVSIERVAQALSQAHPQRTQGWRIELPAPGQALVTARYLKPAETAGQHFAPLLVTVDSNTGEVLANRFWGDTVMTWLYDLHYTLLLGEAGHKMVAVAGLLLMTSVFSGLWLWWPRAGHWRSALHFKRQAPAPRRVYDLHKWSGLVAVPFLLVLGLTGAVLGWPAVADPVITLFSAPTATPMPVSHGDARLPRLPVDTVLQQLHTRWPSAQVRWIDVPGTSAAAPYRVRVRHPGDPGDRFPSSIVWLDARTGEILAARQPDHFSGADVFKQWMHPLHSGEAFGLVGRLAICACGWLPLALAVTGWLRWRDKRRVARRRWLVAATVLALAACGPAKPALRNFDITGAAYGRDFSLTDPAGRTRTLADFKGRAVLIFFGFTQCPSVCPTALARAVQVRQQLGDRADRLQVIFVTLDPERDKPTLLKAYTEAFDPGFLGLYTDVDRTASVAKDFKVFYRKVPTGGSYTMDHTATSYLYDPQGRLRAAIPHEASAEAVVHDVSLLLDTRH